MVFDSKMINFIKCQFLPKNVTIHILQNLHNFISTLVLAPHSTYFDTLAHFLLGCPSAVSMSGVRKLPLIGKMFEFIQSIFVNRDDPQSRYCYNFKAWSDLK